MHNYSLFEGVVDIASMKLECGLSESLESLDPIMESYWE